MRGYVPSHLTQTMNTVSLHRVERTMVNSVASPHLPTSAYLEVREHSPARTGKAAFFGPDNGMDYSWYIPPAVAQHSQVFPFYRQKYFHIFSFSFVTFMYIVSMWVSASYLDIFPPQGYLGIPQNSPKKIRGSPLHQTSLILNILHGARRVSEKGYGNGVWLMWDWGSMELDW